jgi:hypothetical protein
MLASTIEDNSTIDHNNVARHGLAIVDVVGIGCVDLGNWHQISRSSACRISDSKIDASFEISEEVLHSMHVCHGGICIVLRQLVGQLGDICMRIYSGMQD